MCAGGGYMYQISNEKFGLFVTELRKKKNLTQKDLAEKLYVSDKTVSKWERGLSMPNVVLLIPIADVWKIFARYVFHYNGFFFRYGFNENGEFEIRTYKRVEDAEE